MLKKCGFAPREIARRCVDLKMSLFDPKSVKSSLTKEADLLETTAGAAGIFGPSTKFGRQLENVRGVEETHVDGWGAPELEFERIEVE